MRHCRRAQTAAPDAVLHPPRRSGSTRANRTHPCLRSSRRSPTPIARRPFPTSTGTRPTTTTSTTSCCSISSSGRRIPGEDGFGWDTKGWVGRDRDRLWFRTEGQRAGDSLNDAQSHVFYGHQFARWWDVLVGVRQDFAPGPAQTWMAVGVQGLAPYWFNVEATAYVGANGA